MTRIRPAFQSSNPRGFVVLGIAVAVFAFIRYQRTMAPTVLSDDPAEMQVLAWALGIPHSTGYPLYIWLCKLFTYLPIGDVAYRVNLLSVFFGGASVFMIYMLCGMLIRGRGWIPWISAAAAALLFSGVYMFWYEALLAEMYTLHTFLALLVIYAAARWSDSGNYRLALVAAFLLGAMFGNHATTVALIPGLLFYALSHTSKRWFCWRRLAGTTGAFLGGIVVCNLFLFWLLWIRHVPFDHWHSSVGIVRDLYGITESQARSFWFAWKFVASGAQWKEGLVETTNELRYFEARLIPLRLLGAYFPVAVMLAAGGWIVLWRRFRLNLALTIIFVTQCTMNFLFQVPWKVSFYYSVPYALTAIWIAAALAKVGSMLESKLTKGSAERGGKNAMPKSAAAFLALLLILGVANEGSRKAYASWVAGQGAHLRREIAPSLAKRPNLRGHFEDRDHARTLLDGIPGGAIVFTDWKWRYAIEYVARVERGMETLTVLESHPEAGGRSGTFPDAYVEIIRKNLAQRPIYFTYDPTETLGAGLEWDSPEEGLWRLRPVPAPPSPLR